MKTERIVRSAEMWVGAREIEGRTRQVMQEADVSRVSVKDRHGHTLLEVPVSPAEVPMLLEPVVAAVRAVSETVGEVTLRVEKTPGIPSATGAGQATTGERGGAGMREREERRQGERRQGGQGEPRQGGGQGERRLGGGQGERRQGGGGQPTATVTQQDVDRIREANQVPTGDEATMRRIAPEQEGEPDLKDTGEWPHARQR